MLSEKLPAGLLDAVLVLFVGSAGINAWLANTIVAMAKKPAQFRQPAIGERLPAIDLTDPAGKLVTLEYASGQRSTVIYWFGPNCIWCKRNHANIVGLSRALHVRYRFVGIASSTDGLREYLAEQPHNFPIYTDPSGAARLLYGLSGTPQTLVLSPEGKLVMLWRGAYNGENARQVEEFFGVNLAQISHALPAQHPGTDCDGCSVPISQTPAAGASLNRH